MSEGLPHIQEAETTRLFTHVVLSSQEPHIDAFIESLKLPELPRPNDKSLSLQLRTECTWGPWVTFADQLMHRLDLLYDRSYEGGNDVCERDHPAKTIITVSLDRDEMLRSSDDVGAHAQARLLCAYDAGMRRLVRSSAEVLRLGQSFYNTIGLHWLLVPDAPKAVESGAQDAQLQKALEVARRQFPTSPMAEQEIKRIEQELKFHKEESIDWIVKGLDDSTIMDAAGEREQLNVAQETNR